MSGRSADTAKSTLLTLTGHRLEWNSAPQHLDFRTIQACPKDLPGQPMVG
jgi:hypothetical protein